ncbi:hypothetical protein V8C42DRAFT_334984 [Trichoderma barbatum]
MLLFCVCVCLASASACACLRDDESDNKRQPDPILRPKARRERERWTREEKVMMERRRFTVLR